uniref:Uncharacterized protein n=1 Tax=Triticum urartu TaxID=4572 RepID=A0A8R7QMN5_TRIUA
MERLDPVSKREAKKASHKATAEHRIKPAPQPATRRRLRSAGWRRGSRSGTPSGVPGWPRNMLQSLPRQLLKRGTSAGVSLPEQRVGLMVQLQPPLLSLQLQLQFLPRQICCWHILGCCCWSVCRHGVWSGKGPRRV